MVTSGGWVTNIISRTSVEVLPAGSVAMRVNRIRSFGQLPLDTKLTVCSDRYQRWITGPVALRHRGRLSLRLSDLPRGP